MQPANPRPHSAPKGAVGAESCVPNSQGNPMMRATVVLAVAALTAPLAASAQTLDLPLRKAGLWEVTMTVEKPKVLPAVTTKVCLNPATDRDLMDYGLKLTGGKCKKLTTSRQGKSYMIDA